MGGLVARRYIIDNPGAVNKQITVAAPFLGSPKPLFQMIYGKLAAVVSKEELVLEPLYGEYVKDMLAYYPGLHQLISSRAYYDIGGPPYSVVETLTEAAQSGSLPATKELSFDQLMGPGGVVDQLFPNPSYNGKTPSQSNREFHGYTSNGNSQDDWSNDTTGVRYYHLIGVQGSLDTPQSLREAHGFTALQLRDYALHPEGPGDGTVPRLSAERKGGLDLNAPDAQLFVYSTGSDELQEHTGLMINPRVIDKVLELLRIEDPAPPPPIPTPTPTPSLTPTPEPTDSAPPPVAALGSCSVAAGPSAQELGYVVPSFSNVEVPPELRVISVVEYPVEAPQRRKWRVVTIELENVTPRVLSINDMFISFYKEDGSPTADSGGNMPAYSLGALGRGWTLAPGERVAYTGTVPDDPEIAQYRLSGSRAGASNTRLSFGPLKVLDVVMAAGSNQVTAVLKNTGSQPVTLTNVHGTFYGAEGVALASGSYHRSVSFRQTIEPGRLLLVGAAARSYYNGSYMGPVTSAYILDIKGELGSRTELVAASVSGCADFPSLEIASQSWSEVMEVEEAEKLDTYNGYVYYRSRRWAAGIVSGVIRNAADKRVSIELVKVAGGAIPIGLSKKELGPGEEAAFFLEYLSQPQYISGDLDIPRIISLDEINAKATVVHRLRYDLASIERAKLRDSKIPKDLADVTLTPTTEPTVTPTVTATASPTPSATPSPSPTPSPTPTPTPTPTARPDQTPRATATSTPRPTSTATPTLTAAPATPTSTPTPVPTPTAVPSRFTQYALDVVISNPTGHAFRSVSAMVTFYHNGRIVDVTRVDFDRPDGRTAAGVANLEPGQSTTGMATMRIGLPSAPTWDVTIQTLCSECPIPELKQSGQP